MGNRPVIKALYALAVVGGLQVVGGCSAPADPGDAAFQNQLAQAAAKNKGEPMHMKKPYNKLPANVAANMGHGAKTEGTGKAPSTPSGGTATP